MGEAGTDDDVETWELVHFIRHLPRLTPKELAEMEELNPKKALREEDEIRRFLEGETAEASMAQSGAAIGTERRCGKTGR